MDMCLLALFILSMSVAADLRGGFGDFSSSPHPKSQEHINILFSRLFNITIWLLIE
jgi:hypothetical protein